MAEVPHVEGRFAYEGLDRVIHERARLSVLTSLITNPKGLAFGDLKQLCDLDGWKSEQAFEGAGRGGDGGDCEDDGSQSAADDMPHHGFRAGAVSGVSGDAGAGG
jgi:hypothetical protein